MASTLTSYANSTMRERGVDIAILGVDIAILGVDIAIIGVDHAILRRQQKRGGATGGGRARHSGPRCRHIRSRCGYSNPRCRHSNLRCGYSKPEEAREKGGGVTGGGRRERLAV